MRKEFQSEVICRGREQELDELRRRINQYSLQTSILINLFGRGGIGKTVLTEKLYKEYSESVKMKHQNAEVIYVNASGCFTIPELLFLLRMELNNKRFGKRKYDFEKFDTMFELCYDASRFIQENKIKKLMQKAAVNDIGSGDYSITESMEENSANLAELLIEPLIKSAAAAFSGSGIKGEFAEKFIEIVDVAGPIMDRIPIVALISNLKEIIQDSVKRKRYINILQEIRDAQGLFSQESKLVDFFVDAVFSNDKSSSEKCEFYFFIDNFQNPKYGDAQHGEFSFQNIGRLLEMFRNCPALWFISSRNPLPQNWNYHNDDNSYELKGLKREAAVEIIENVPDAVKLNENNRKDIITNILKLAQDNGTSDDNNNIEATEIRYSPIILDILCQVLEKEIEDTKKRALDTANYTISPNIFREIRDNSALAYYFEMGKNAVELDCFHILSCADVWDEKTLSILRNNIQLYLLNTRYILAEDSMTEVVGNRSIKLHDEITNALRNSVNNRIQYDVYSIMYKAFLGIQETSPILDEGVLRNFFMFAKAYCENIHKSTYDYLKLDAFDTYIAYYNAFLNSIKKMNEWISDGMIDIYWNVVKEYRRIATKCNVNDLKPVYDAYHELGIVVYNSGDSKKASEIDDEYVKFVEEANDAYALAKALNSLAFDLSANHLYSEAYGHGKRSLEVALEAILRVAEEKKNKIAGSLYEFYKQFFLLSENNKENCQQEIESFIKQNSNLLNTIYTISEADDSYIVKVLWEQMLTTRGNIPWYFIEDKDSRAKHARFALDYGKTTYLLRKYYYGADNPKTLQSFHNTGAYLLKYAEYCLRGEITDRSLDLSTAFAAAENIFAEAFQERQKYLKKSSRIDREKYLLDIEKTSSNNGPGFLEIYNIGEIDECYNGKLAECPNAALESLQYQSYAYYMLSIIQEDKSDQEVFLQKAVSLSDKVTIARSIVLGPCHRKTLESMRYSAEYYFASGDKEKASIRMCYAFKHLKNTQVSTEQYEEYSRLYDEMSMKNKKQIGGQND